MTSTSVVRALIGMLLFSATLPALSEEDRTLCPSPEIIKMAPQKLNTVMALRKGKFVICGINPVVEAHQFWYLLTFVSAADFNNAYVAGQKNVKDVSAQIDKYAVTFRNMRVCSYIGEGSSMQMVMAVAPKQLDASLGLMSFDPAVLDPHES